ncbi:MAG: porin [Bacteroidales bacterium]
MRKILLFVLISFLSLLANAQGLEKADSKLLQDFHQDPRFASLPYYSYGKGLGMTSPDSLYNINIRFRMQSRATFISDGDSTMLSAQVRRLRLRFDGFVGSPKFQYVIQLSFTHGDVNNPDPDGLINIIRDAAVLYKPNNKFQLLFGQTKLPGNRQRLNSSGALELTDRSINNALFTIDRDFGIQAKNFGTIGKMLYIISGAISTGEGRGWRGVMKPADLAYTGKLEIYPFGQFKKNGAYFEGDVLREESPKLMLSGAYSYNKGTNKARGQLGVPMPEKRDISSTFVDAMFKYNGWGAFASFMMRDCDKPIVSGTDSEGNSYFYEVSAGKGTDLQVSYTTKNKWAFTGRYSYQDLDKELNDNSNLNLPDQNDYSLGITKYVWEHAFKFQGEFTYGNLVFNTHDVNTWYFRMQVEIGI